MARTIDEFEKQKEALLLEFGAQVFIGELLRNNYSKLRSEVSEAEGVEDELAEHLNEMKLETYHKISDNHMQQLQTIDLLYRVHEILAIMRKQGLGSNT